MDPTRKQDRRQTLEDRTVRIALAIHVGVVSPVTGDPLLGDNAGGKPEPSPHRKRNKGVQGHTTVGHAPVEENGRRGVRQMP
jgi:hypothetical protein